MSRRLARLNSLFKRELSELISTRLRDPRIGLATVVAVEVAPDLGSAKVFVRPLAVGKDAGRDDDAERLLAGLRNAAPVLRRALGESLRIRRVPELRFRSDRSLEHSRRIDELLAKLDARGDVSG